MDFGGGFLMSPTGSLWKHFFCFLLVILTPKSYLFWWFWDSSMILKATVAFLLQKCYRAISRILESCKNYGGIVASSATFWTKLTLPERRERLWFDCYLELPTPPQPTLPSTPWRCVFHNQFAPHIFSPIQQTIVYSAKTHETFASFAVLYFQSRILLGIVMANLWRIYSPWKFGSTIPWRAPIRPWMLCTSRPPAGPAFHGIWSWYRKWNGHGHGIILG